MDTHENALPGGEILLAGAPWRVLRPSEMWGYDKQRVFRRQVKRVFRQRNPFWVRSVVRHASPARYTDSCGAPLGPSGEDT